MDEVYIGVNKRGAQFVFPVEAKGKSEKIGALQIEQNLEMAEEKFSALRRTPIAAQTIDEETVCLMSFAKDETGEIVVENERHYRLCPPSEISDAELIALRDRENDD